MFSSCLLECPDRERPNLAVSVAAIVKRYYFIGPLWLLMDPDSNGEGTGGAVVSGKWGRRGGLSMFRADTDRPKQLVGGLGCFEALLGDWLDSPRRNSNWWSRMILKERLDGRG